MTGAFSGPLVRLLGPVLLMAGVSAAHAQAGGKVDYDALPPQPYPAEIMPRADKDLALDVTWTGERYLAVGDRGHILVSDAGRDWVQVNVPVRAALRSSRLVSLVTRRANHLFTSLSTHHKNHLRHAKRVLGRC